MIPTKFRRLLRRNPVVAVHSRPFRLIVAHYRDIVALSPYSVVNDQLVYCRAKNAIEREPNLYSVLSPLNYILTPRVDLIHLLLGDVHLHRWQLEPTYANQCLTRSKVSPLGSREPALPEITLGDCLIST